MTKSRKPHPIVQVAQIAASELNDLLNAIGLRVSLLRHQLAASAYETEMVRLAGLVEKASQRVQRLEEYARAEQLSRPRGRVAPKRALMLRGRIIPRLFPSQGRGPPF